MNESKSPSFVRLCLAVLAVIAFGALAVLPLRAETVYVGAYTGSDLTVCDPYCNNPLAFTGVSISTFGSTAVASPPGMPARTKCTYGYAGHVNWSIKPPTLVDGGVYRIETAHNATSSCSTDTIMTVWSNDGTTSSQCTNTTVFDQAHGGNTWQTVGYITNNPGVTSPTIYFDYVSGTLSVPPATTWRIYIDAFKFTLIDPCDGVVADVAVTGPLAANQDFVPVTGITAGATNITIYANDAEIGQTNYAPGFAAGALNVPVTTALVKDAVIKATQSKPSAAPAGFCTSTYPVTGPVVGGGANPQLSVVLTCGAQDALTGPAGADTSGAVTVEYHVKCTGLIGAGGTAPVGGAVLTPGSCWQTVTFNLHTDPCRAHQGNTDYTVVDPYAELIALSFAIDSTSPDSGPYDIYVDLIKNGDVVIENFEGWNSGSGVMFNTPNVATIPPPGATYLGAPNSALVSRVNAYEGTNSCRIRWQFATTDTIRWARVLASRSNGATYPQLDTSKPVTVRLLVLPVNETTNKLSVGTLPSQTKNVGQSVTFTAPAKGEGPFTYEWKKNGSAIVPPATASSYTIDSVATGHAGLYSVVVDNTACDPVESSPAQLTVQVATSPVTISSIAGTSVNYTGGAGAQFVLLKSANITTPLSSWTREATNTFTPGSFTIPAVGTPPGPVFYRIKSE